MNGNKPVWLDLVENNSTLFLATMNRSGTWYIHFLFEYFEQFLSGNREIIEAYELNYYENIRCLKFLAHALFPDFDSLYTGPLRPAWDHLEFYTDIWDQGAEAVHEYPDVFSPRLNKKLTIVYLYRNPLDNCISAFHHYKRHSHEGHRFYLDRISGERKPFTSPSEYLRNGGLDGYIKQFFSFHAMREHKNLLMIRYEDLVASPEENFARILSLIGFSIDNDVKLQGLMQAVFMAQPENIRELEKSKGRSLANDQLDSKSSQMRGGTTGKWKNELSDADVKYCMDRLDEFGLDTNDFVFE